MLPLSISGRKMRFFACEKTILQEIDVSKESGIPIPLSFAGCRNFFDTLLNVIHPRGGFVLSPGEAAFGGKARETLLAQGLVHHDGDGVS